MFDKSISLTVLLCLLTAASTFAVPANSPLPTVKIQIEQAPIFEFCVIPLEIGAEPFAAREFWMGGREAQGFREPPTRTRMAGSIIFDIRGKPDWCILLGKTEVTIAQWHAIIGTPVPLDTDGQLPVTRISRAEVAVFIEKLNERIKHRSSAQSITSAIGNFNDNTFIRLPLENEWEFAARGGRAVDENIFDKLTPYTGELNRYEWFFSQSSSKGKLKQAGLLEPNPLGLFDVLGNASEIVESYYQTEYSQGRHGGGIARGGDFRTEEKDISSSKRTELPLVFQEGDAYKNGTVGFRLAIGSLVIPPTAAGVEQLEAAWRDHSAHRMQPIATAPSISAVSEVSGKELGEINDLIKSLGKKLDLGNGDQLSAQQTLSAMEVRTASLLGNLERANKNFAAGMARVASVVSINYFNDSAKILRAQDSSADSNVSSLFKSRDLYERWKTGQTSVLIPTCEAKMKESALLMQDTIKMLGELPRESVQVAFSDLMNPMEEGLVNATDDETKAARMRQIKATKAAMKATMDYVINRRINLDEWKETLAKLSRDMVDQAMKKAINEESR
ncbi:MAG: SUMF1/EgtB/PvdO family nonheme iron enzyme [Luteolibacter sp.]